MPRRPSFRSAAPRFVALALLALAVHTRPAAAAWSNSGNPAADSSSRGERPNAVMALSGGVIVTSSFSNDDSLSIQKLGPTGTKLWGGSQGIRVNSGGNAVSGAFANHDSAGGVWVTWVDSRTSAPGIYVQHYASNSAATLADGGLRIYHRQPVAIDVATTSAGELLIAFVTPGDSVLVQRVSLAGAEEWPGDGVLLAVDATTLTHAVSVFPDGEGCFAVYGRFLPIDPNPNSYVQIWANRVSAAGTVQWGANGAVVFQNIGDNAIVHRAAHDGQSLFVSWLDAPATFSFVEAYPIRAQRLSLNGVRQWGPLGVQVFAPVTGSPFFEPFFSAGDHVLASDGAGGCIAAWLDTRHYYQPAPNTFLHGDDVYGQRLDGVGAPQWQGNGAPLDTLPGGLDDLRGVADGAGGLLLAYTDFTFGDGDEDVRLRRVSGAGTSSWNTFVNSLNGSEPPSRDRDPVLCADGAGGAFVAWRDNRNPSTSLDDAYAAHRTGTGSSAAPTLTVIAPNGGEVLPPKALFPLTWSSTLLDPAEQVRLEFGAPGQPRTLIQPNATNDGAFDYIVEDAPASQMKFYASLSVDPTVADSSNAFFAICPSLAVEDSVGSFDAPNDHRVVDVDRDGILDVVVAHATGAAVLFGNGSGGIGDGTFLAPLQLPIGTGGRDVAVEDLNADGIADLAVTTTNGVSVLLGQGGGGQSNRTFGSPVNYPCQSGPRGIAAADFDEDGILDLAVVSGVSNTMSILLGNGTDGNGDGTFPAAVNYPVGNNPQKVAAGDFNEDGIWDLACTNNNASGSISVLIGQGTAGVGDGTFAAAATYTTGPNPIGLATGDLTGDGITDIFTANGSGVTVNSGSGAAGVGNGAFGSTSSALSIGGAARDVEAFDVNGDGTLDLVVSSSTLNAIVIRYRTIFGGNVSGAAIYAGLGANALGLGDLNHDGSIDVVCGNLTGDNLTVLPGGCGIAGGAVAVVSPDGGEYLKVGTEQTLTWTRSAATPFVDLEISRAPGQWETIARRVLETSLAWTVTPPATPTARLRVVDGARGTIASVSPQTFAIGATDVLLLEPNGGRTIRSLEADTIRWTSTGFSTTVRIEYTLDGGARQTIAALTSNDGFHVWIPPDTSTSDLRVFVKSTASPSQEDGSDAGNAICEHFAPPALLAGLCCPRGIAAADFDEDGVLDLVAGSDAGVERWPGSGGGGFGAPAAFAAGSDATHVATGDFDDDGILDVVADGSGGLAVLLGQGSGGIGDGTFAAGTTVPTGGATNGVAVSDLDEDGILDLVTTHPGVNQVAVVLGQGAGGIGNGTFGPAATYALPGAPQAPAIADFDADGIWDVAVGVPGGVAILIGNGTGGDGDGTFAPAIAYAVSGGSGSPAIADFTADGDLDLMMFGTDGLRVLAGNGDGTFAAATLAYSTSNASLGLRVTDLDGDPRPDLLALLDATPTQIVGLVNAISTSGKLFEVGRVPLGVGPGAALPLATDLDGDLAPDFALGLDGAGSIRLALGDPCSALPGVVSIVPPGAFAARETPRGSGGAGTLEARPVPAATNTVWPVGSEQNLSWTRSPWIHAVRLEVSRDGGANWETIAREAPGTSLVWTVTPPQGSALFRVSDAAAPSVAAATSAPVTLDDPTVAVGGDVPARAAFSAPRPNPARGAVRFEIALPRAADVRVDVFDLGGRRVATLADAPFGPGAHTLAWRPGADPLPAGVYLVRARWEGFEQVRRVVRVP